jgi:hypothetical protein
MSKDTACPQGELYRGEINTETGQDPIVRPLQTARLGTLTRSRSLQPRSRGCVCGFGVVSRILTEEPGSFDILTGKV